MADAASLAAALADGADIPDPLPCPALDLLQSLHAEILGDMRSDLARAARAAAAARAIAARFPTDPLLQAQAHWSSGSAILYVPRYAESLAHYDESLRWYDLALERAAPAEPQPDIRVVEVMRVFCLNELGRFAEAERAAARAETWLRDHPSPRVRLTLLINRSQLAGQRGDYAAMLALTDAIVDLAERLGSPARAAMGWINRAYACIWLGRFAEAEQALAAGEAAAAAAGEPLTVARAQINRAWLLRCTGRLFAALQTLQVAERGMAQAEGETATVALEQAALYAQLRQLPEALAAAERAAGLFDAQRMPLYSAGAYLQAARLAVEMRRSGAAGRLIDHARARAASLGLPSLGAEIVAAEALVAALPGVRRGRRAARAAAARAADTLAAAGLVREELAARLALADLDAALGHTRRARQGYAAVLQSPAADSAARMAAHGGLGALLAPELALEHLRAAAELAVIQRRALPMEELQARYSSETARQQMALAAALLAWGDTPAALECIWQAKAGPLLDLRAAASPLAPADQAAIDAARAELARLRAGIAELQPRLLEAMQAGYAELAAHYRAEIEAAHQTVAASERRLTEAARTLADRTGQGEIPGLAAAQAALPTAGLLLEFARLDDRFVCLILGPEGGPVCRPLAAVARVTNLISRWQVVQHSDPEGRYPAQTEQRRRQVLADMHAALIAPLADLLAGAARLLIAPADILAHVPWAALASAGPALAEQMTISITPSGALWAARFVSPPAAGPPRVLGFPGAGARYLPHVRAEVALVAGTLSGAMANPAASGADLRAGPPPRLLHIACHGVTRPDAPTCSYLELADGPFLLLEAHRLNLRGAELVTLSACETGERPGYGEMALALAGAFLCAGARAVLASLWAVDDRAAADLMGAFYRRFAAGAAPADALRAAQHAIRDAHPHHWAAFQLWEGAP